MADPDSFSVSLEDFLLALPPWAPYAVEVRHPGFFAGTAATELDAVLGELGVDRVILDARGVHEPFDVDVDDREGTPSPTDPALLQAHERKPALQVEVFKLKAERAGGGFDRSGWHGNGNPDVVREISQPKPRKDRKTDF